MRGSMDTMQKAEEPAGPLPPRQTRSITLASCVMSSLDVDPETGVDPVLYAGASRSSPSKRSFQRKPPHLDHAREYKAHGNSHLAARGTVAMLSEKHRERQIEQEETFDRMTKAEKYRTTFVETRLATCGPPTLNTMDVRITRERATATNQSPTQKLHDWRIREAIRRAYGSRVLDLKSLDLVHIPSLVFSTLLLQLGRFIAHVNVSRNALRDIPERFILAFPQATTLNVKENALDRLPQCMDKLTSLAELHAECNQLRTMPLRLPVTLQRLVVGRNRLVTVPHLHSLIHLVELDLSHNHLELLPPGMPFLSKLIKLTVSSNRLVSLALLPRFLIPEKTMTKRLDDGEDDGSDTTSDDDDGAATWTRERIDLEQKKWRIETDPLTGDTVYFHVHRKRVSRVKPRCFRVHVPLLAIGKTGQKKTHAQWIAVFPDGWEVTVGGVCINKHGRETGTESRPVTGGEEEHASSSLQSLRLSFTHHVTHETFVSLPLALDKWGELHRLQSLHVGGNQLVELPSSIGQLVQLKLLDVEHNKLQSLPDTFHEMRSLETVRFAMNALSWLPPSFCALPSLTELDLKINRFAGLPEEIGSLQRLRVLDLSSNSLASLPKALLSLKKLTTLRLQGNTELVTSGLLKPETLASGDIAQVAWHLRHQLQIEQDHGGQRAPLSESQAVGVGNEAWSTNHHVHRAFTQAIALAQQSHTLDFHWKHLGIAQFPPTFFTTLRALRELRLSGQDLDVLPSAFATVCGSLRVLQLRNNNLRRMDDDVFDCDSLEPLPLEELDLECNGLESLPRSIGRLTSLRVLRVSNNKLTHDGLPESFANLTSLAELYMTHNRLMQPSATFSSLVSLEKLDMSYNQLTTLATTAFAPLQRLRQLRVSVNALTDLPDDLALAPIEELLIAGNRLESLPATVLLLKTSLRVLRMQSNKISRLPLAFGELEALEVVEADGNPFRSPPPEIMNSSIRLIRTYLRKRHERVHEMQRLLQTLRIPNDDSVFADPTLARLLVRENGTHDSKALAFLTEKHLVAFERAVDAYVNGAFYLSPSTLRGADLVTELLLQKQFFLAQQHRAHVLRDLVRLCALVRDKKWLDKVDFRFDLRRPWGRLGEDCSVYALNPRALYDDSPELPSVLSVIRKRVHHGFESEAFDHAEETVRDAIENYLGVYGPVGVCHDDVPFKCGCEELLRFNKKHEPCFRVGWSFVQVVYTPEEAERRVRDEETIQNALEALRPQVETFLQTAEGQKRFHKEVQALKNALRKDLKAKKKRLKLLRAKHTKMKRVRDKEKQREAKATKLQATEKTLTVGEVAERAEQEEKFKTLSERLDEATKEYQKGKNQLGQGYGAFLDDVVTLLLEKIGSEVRNHLVQQQRQKAIELGLRRPWDGPNGRDFEAYKHLVRRRMLGDGSMEREDAGVADGGGGGLVEGGEKPNDDRGSDNSEISDVSFAGYDDLVSNLQAPDAGVDDDREDDDDDDEGDDDTVEARAEALAKLEVSDVSDTEDREGSAHGKLESEDSDL